ncbi:MAG: hypothetical protein F4X65_12480 [Chloroflexi bacterium]|nr:hypothetical protein [Chloroflexota bacterium]
MLNFTPRHLHHAPVLMLRTWAFCSVAVPIAMTTLCVLLLVGVAALFGAPIGPVAINFLTDAMEPLARVTVQLWVTAFFMMAACYGVSRQLIRRTLKNPITAPLAMLAHRVLNRVRCRNSTLPLPATAGSLAHGFSQSLAPDPVINPPPAALLTGAAPLLE